MLAKDVLRELRSGRTDLALKQLNMAIVIDEYSGLAGIITLEDIVEQIFGELYDEGERRELDPVIRLEPGQGYRIMADTPVWQVQDHLDIALPDGWRDETFSAYLVDRLGHIPAKDEQIDLDGSRVVVERTSKNRIVSCRFFPGGDHGEDITESAE